MFKKILIANRGEIACRIMATARRLNIATVAVYSQADCHALHVQLADEAVCIGPAASSDSYLRGEHIIDACHASGAEAVHPGYGFLSENAHFVESLAAAGIAFIGPDPRAITVMGDKITAKQIAEKAGVNVIPGFTDVLKDEAHAVEVARAIGYPVMLKASAGGGGKGMRVVANTAECREGFARASSEARSSFGDDRIFMEKYIENPRHIEIQIMADAHGNVIYLGERECSIQRRHQKVIEEAPSPLLDPGTRERMGDQAVALAKAVQYRSAGTVEFVVDNGQNFYFLEMNTRLQVEHPVTEAITGLDLVELMLRVAAGETLPLRQEQVSLCGWALECRLYAEDPIRGFLPSSGRLVRFTPPRSGPAVRLDSGVEEGSEVSMYYDPMLAKLISHGEDRKQAIDIMSTALDGFYIQGVASNLQFLASLIHQPRFREGLLTTHFIDEEYAHGFNPGDGTIEDPRILVAAAAWVHIHYRQRAAGIEGQLVGFERIIPEDWVVVFGDRQYPCTVKSVGGRPQITYDGKILSLESDWRCGQVLFEAKVCGTHRTFQIRRQGLGYQFSHAGSCHAVLVLSPREAQLLEYMPVKAPMDLSAFLLSPMPGLLLSLSVEPGDEVKAGQELAVIEAMKMENVLRADADKVIREVLVKVGDSLMVDEKIIAFE